MSATKPATLVPTLSVSVNVFFMVFDTKKLPYAILFSLANTTPPSNVIPTAVAPGMYIDMFCFDLDAL
jgi:hypothetical protein